MKDHEYSRTFSFGPIERRGLVGALKPSQAVVLIGASVCGVLVVRALPAGSGFAVALVVIAIAAAIAFVPVRGRPVVLWLPIVIDWVGLDARDRRSYRSRQPSAGTVAGLDG